MLALPVDAAERLFTLGFALEQMRKPQRMAPANAVQCTGCDVAGRRRFVSGRKLRKTKGARRSGNGAKV
jgi:hypothetical protein